MLADQPPTRFEATLEEPIRVDRDKLREVKWSDLAIRFGFGAAVSVLAGVVAVVFGDRPAGLFLAFPAILPASLTLIDQKDGRGAAEVDAAGAAIGAVALVPFAIVCWAGLTHISVAAVEPLALMAWLVAGGILYWAARSVARRRT